VRDCLKGVCLYKGMFVIINFRDHVKDAWIFEGEDGVYNAQACQDIFVDKILDKDNGFFLDIGAGTGGLEAHRPGFYSNTFFFEASRKWDGIAIDYDKEWFDAVHELRRSKCLCEDLLKVDINQILDQNNCPQEIDYLSIDVDEAQRQVFSDFDFEKYKFKVLTLEHNVFKAFGQGLRFEDRTRILKEYALYRKVLESYGYHRLWSNVHLKEYGAIEDWWVNKELYELYSNIVFKEIDCEEAIKIRTKKRMLPDSV
jgi:hypothetical protein